MFPKPETRSLARQNIVFICLFIGWSLLVLSSAGHEWYAEQEARTHLAAVQAEALVDKDIVYRLWNSNHGGLYAPVTGETRPNPYLDAPTRDLDLPSGQRLTLINPAYMTRQVHELQKKHIGALGHLTSLKLLNPANKPDSWEETALKELEAGKKKVVGIETMQGQPHLRLMKPLVVTEGCLHCHAIQGYRLGEVRGGLSASLPLRPFQAAQESQQRAALIAHALFWLLGLVGLSVGYVFLRRWEKERLAGEKKISSLSLAVQQSPAAVVITNPGGAIEYVNPKFTEMTGYNQDEVLGRNPRILKSNHHDREFYGRLWSSLKSGREWRGEFYNRRKDGSCYWEFASISPVKAADGTLIHYVAVKEDITSRKEAEAELRRQKDFVETVLNSIPEAISILNVHDCAITGANQAFLAEAGLPLNQVLGRRCHELIHGQTQKCLAPDQLCPLVEALKDGSKITTDHLYYDPLGREKVVEISVHPLRDEKGLFSQVVHISRDVTAQKTAAKAMIQAKEAAEAASRAKSEFLANLSHEFRTPMNGIIGLTDLTLNTDLTEEQHEYLNLIKTSADGLQTLLNDVLDLSKIEAGRLDLEDIPFRLRGALKEAVDTLAPRARQKGLELILDVQPDAPDHLEGDPGRLRQIILNLVGNAIKFTEQGRVSLEAELESTGEMETALHFTVTDTGIGIPEEKQALIFEAFTQADGSTTRKYGGTGLGLTIAARLVQMLKGRLWVQSRMGQGSAFHFTATFRKAAAVETGQREAGSAAADIETSPASAGGLRILLAEDNPINQKVAQRILEQAGHRVTLVETGRQALARLEGECFDLVIMDIQMPEMDGLEALKVIREKEKISGGHLTIVAMTAHALKGDQERFLASGFDGYLAKPISPEHLRKYLRRQVRGAGQAQAAAPPPAAKPAAGGGFDPSSLMARVGGDTELIKQMTTLFLEELTVRLDEIRRALAAGDASALGRAAHSLKGSISYFSSPGASEAVQTLVRQAKAGDLTNAGEVLLALEMEAEGLGKDLRTWLGTIETDS
ncbi:MAG: PAS domain S-box protein [Thermodesulfobacteriota bacterium]